MAEGQQPVVIIYTIDHTQDSEAPRTCSTYCAVIQAIIYYLSPLTYTTDATAFVLYTLVQYCCTCAWGNNYILKDVFCE